MMRFSIFFIFTMALSCLGVDTYKNNKVIEKSTKAICNFDKQCYSYSIFFSNNSATNNPKLEICIAYDSIFITFENEKFKANYTRKNDGIYIDNILTHAFLLDTTVNIPKTIRLEPIINKTTKLVDTKSYLIKNNKYKVLKYYEDYNENSHSLIVSYYLDNGIPLIYSKYYLKTYFFIKNDKYLELVNTIVQDDDYFEMENLEAPIIEE